MDPEAESKRTGLPRAPERDAVTPIVPRPFGRYTLIGQVGHGATGTAYLALTGGAPGFRKVVVLKILHDHFVHEPEVVEMFLDEARIAALMQHPNAVGCFEADEVGGRPYIAMEYVSGLPAEDLMRHARLHDRPVPPEFAARVCADVLSVLEHAHALEDLDGSALHVVHRDVSPTNVMLGWDGAVKLLDFGVAKAESRRTASESGTIRGRVGYISPEQAQSFEVDGRADLWSVGVILWEMLANARLFDADNQIAVLRKVVDGELVELPEGTPPALQRVCEKALVREPEGRFPDAAAMRAELEAYCAEVETPTGREDLAALLGDLFQGERERQHVLLRRAVDGAEILATATGSYAVSEIADRVTPTPTVPPEPYRPEAPATPDRVPIYIAALSLLAIVVLVMGAYLKPPRAPVPEEPSPDSASETPAPPPTTDALPREAPVRPSGDDGPTSPTETPTPPAPSPSPPPATEEVPERPEARPRRLTGTLSIDSTPWSRVHLGRRSLGTTPILDRVVPAGTHTITLENPERGLRRTVRVRVEAGAHVRRRVTLASTPEG